MVIRTKTFILFFSMILLVTFGVNLTRANLTQAQEVSLVPQKESLLSTWLLQANDLKGFGYVQVLGSENVIQPEIYGVLRGWYTGDATHMVVIAKDEQVALVNSAVYAFPSKASARVALSKMADPVRQYGWQSAVSDAEIIKPEIAEGFKQQGKVWRTWQGVDDEGVPAYVLWVQNGEYVIEAHINVTEGQEQFGRALFDYVVEKVSERVY
ncbi:MAG: hypothetical protein D6802_05955 [Ardenticatenia bacterium]|nr:MAG: hypothetical protein D6802_05955 [Ardenticatenia bacterium]